MRASELLSTAWSDVKAAGLPDALEELAFRELIHFRLRDGAPRRAADPARRDSGEQAATPKAGTDESGGATEPKAPREEDLYRRVAGHTGVDESKIEKLIFLDDDGIRIVLPGLKLGKSNADRTRTVAQILAVCRGFGLDEEETPLSVIRAECSRLKVYDSANFSTQVSKMPGYVVSGPRENRRLRVRSGAIEAFVSLVDQLLPE